ncbi:MAG: hypothetical protein LBI53_03105 [Candidatus Peribacteria bacterium]|jgi:hypothetical protein|nr:hypothetical protein [Candidatus Peribacteria bacterium]
MRKIALLVFVFLLTGCSQKNITSPLMIVDLIPKNFEIIYFNEDIPYQTKYFLEYKEQGYSCFTET